VADVQVLSTEIRRVRADQKVPPSRPLPARITVPTAGLDAAARALTRLTEPADGFHATVTLPVRLSSGTATVELDTSGVLDVAAEIARATKDLAAAEKEVGDCGRKLGNADFLAKAPDAVVGKIRGRLDKAEQDVARLTERLQQLREVGR
jgi:valyl-tRNA synthetase